jgi:hypothetical protein
MFWVFRNIYLIWNFVFFPSEYKKVDINAIVALIVEKEIREKEKYYCTKVLISSATVDLILGNVCVKLNKNGRIKSVLREHVVAREYEINK